jgi:hypothetical protein
MELRSDNVYDLISSLESRIIQLEKGYEDAMFQVSGIKEALANSLGDMRPMRKSEPSGPYAGQPTANVATQWGK